MNRILVMGGNSWLGCFDFPIVSGFPALFFAHRFWDGYDVVNMGLFPGVLRESERTAAAGVGGSSRYFREDARPREYPVSLLIADLSDTPMSIPSLLGRDILNLHRMIYSPAERRLEFHASV